MLYRAFIDGHYQITVILSDMISTINTDEFKVNIDYDTIDIEKVEKIILHEKNNEQAEKRGYEICEEFNKIRFVLKEGMHDFHLRKAKKSMYIVGDMNDWKLSSDWELIWNKRSSRYELIKDINDVQFGYRFKFAENTNIDLWYPKGFGNDIVIENYFDRDHALTNKIKITTSQRLLPNLKYAITYKNKTIFARPRDILNQEDYFFYDELGCFYSDDKTEFRVWAPTAYKVILNLYDANEAFLASYDMKRSGNGTWKRIIDNNLKNHYYLYEVWHYNYDEETGYKVYFTPDPYSKASSKNSGKTLIFDDADIQIDGWDNDTFLSGIDSQTDAIIYEMHVRDFTIDSTTNIEDKKRGTFLGLCEGGYYKTNISTSLYHLKDLNITHVHLLPINDFGSVDENNTDKKYNWGYDPVLYQTVEGWLSSDREDRLKPIIELRTMIKKLHENNIGVIMDIVFNHTYNKNGEFFSIFDKIVPEYFYRVNDYGEYSNASGCGNEIDSEKPMVRKYILDTILYWCKNFHIDGFRFDLMGLLDINTIRTIAKEVRKVNPKALIYGEGWVMDNSLCLIEERMNIESSGHQGYDIGMFNDRIRDAIRGDLDGYKTGYMHGNIESVEKVKQGVKGGIDDFALNPTECVNYVSCHDNLSLWDKAFKTMQGDDFYYIDRACRFANGIVLTSQGVPFLHGGVEFNRNKKGIANTYNKPDEINKINWRLKERYYDTFIYYKELINLRRNHPAFRMKTAGEIKKYLKFIQSPEGVVAFEITYPYDTWKHIIVAYNPFREIEVLPLREGKWKVAVEDATVFKYNYKEVIGSVELSPLSIFIAFKDE
ncbi:type I pullulanase [Caldicellulosiruptoraceae bacterium PP1]